MCTFSVQYSDQHDFYVDGHHDELDDAHQFVDGDDNDGDDDFGDDDDEGDDDGDILHWVHDRHLVRPPAHPENLQLAGRLWHHDDHNGDDVDDDDDHHHQDHDDNDDDDDQCVTRHKI